MAVHVADPEDSNPCNWRRGSGVRLGVPTPFGFELAVIPVDVDDAIRSAGGWLCDRVRAGWKVNVVVDEVADVRPLEILGIRSFSSDDKFGALKDAPLAALAVAADVISQDIQLLKFIDRVVERKAIEFTLWGEYVPVGLEGRLQRVRNHMSPTAAAFKKYAAGACSITCPADEPVEHFHSSGLWYPTDGTDLVPST